MHLPVFEVMSNLNRGLGGGNTQDLEDATPLNWRTGQDRSNQNTTVERLSFPLGNDEPALEYAHSLNALNAAFGCFPESLSTSSSMNPASVAEAGRSSNLHLGTSDASGRDCHNTAPGGFGSLWQQQPTADPTSALDQALNSPAEIDDATGEMHGREGRVQGMFGRKKAKTVLPVDFKPSRNSVILGRGRCSESSGNRRLKILVHSHLQEVCGLRLNANRFRPLCFAHLSSPFVPWRFSTWMRRESLKRHL